MTDWPRTRWTSVLLVLSAVSVVAMAVGWSPRGGSDADARSGWPLEAEYTVRYPQDWPAGRAVPASMATARHRFVGRGWDDWTNEVLEAVGGGEPAGFVRTHSPDGSTTVYAPQVGDTFVESEADPGTPLAPGRWFNLPNLERAFGPEGVDTDGRGEALRERVQETLPGLAAGDLQARASSGTYACDQAPFGIACPEGQQVTLEYGLVSHIAGIPLLFEVRTDDGHLLTGLEVDEIRWIDAPP